MGRSKVVLAVAIGVIAVGLSAPAAATHITDLKAKMKGKRVVNPSGGAPNGRGKALLDFKVAKRKLCFKITYHRIGGQAQRAEIHKGKRGQIGRTKLTLFDTGRPSPAEGCKKKVRRGLLKRLRRHPRQHYLALENAKFPNGAIRGQLKDAQ